MRVAKSLCVTRGVATIFQRGEGGQTVIKQRVLAFPRPEYCRLFASKRLYRRVTGIPRSPLVKPLMTCDSENYNTKSEIHLKSMQTVSWICECTWSLCDHNRLFYLLGINFGDWRKVRDKSLKIFCFYRVYAMGVHIFKQYYSVRTLSKTSKTDHFSLSFDYINICIDWLFQRVLKGADEKWLGKQNNILKFFYKICFDILMPSSVVMSFRWMN